MHTLHAWGPIGTVLAQYPGMRVAVPIWNGRISPVFDTARQVNILALDRGEVVGRETVALAPDPVPRALGLRERRVDLLICGAISANLEDMVARSGIRVISDICGPVGQVVQAYLDGRLEEPVFRMPGCCGQRRRLRRCRRGPRPPMERNIDDYRG